MLVSLLERRRCGARGQRLATCAELATTLPKFAAKVNSDHHGMVSMIGAIQQSQGQSGTARGSCMAVMSAISVSRRFLLLRGPRLPLAAAQPPAVPRAHPVPWLVHPPLPRAGPWGVVPGA